jgi:hypothetical protein
LKLKTEIVGVEDMDVYAQECQPGVFAELASLDHTSFDVEDAVGDMLAESFLFVAKRVGIGDVGQDSGVFDGFVERDIDWYWPPTMECAGTVTAQRMIWPESVIHFEVELESAEEEEAALDSYSLGTSLERHKGRLVVQRSLVKGVCPVRPAEDGYSPESPARDAFVQA